MTEKEALKNMMELADYLKDKLKNRPDCKKAFQILQKEITTINLRIERGI